jgi:hypothetical protein
MSPAIKYGRFTDCGTSFSEFIGSLRVGDVDVRNGGKFPAVVFV